MTLDAVVHLVLPIAWGLSLLLLTWRVILRPLHRWLTFLFTPRHHRDRRGPGARRHGRGQPPPPDRVEAEAVHTGPYRHTPLSDELVGVIAWLLWATGRAGLDPDDIARQAHATDMARHHRSLARLRTIVDDLAAHSQSDDPAVTVWLMELAHRLRGRQDTHQ